MTSPLPSLVTLDALKAWPGIVIEPDEGPSAQAVLDAASAYVRAESGDDARWPDPATVPASVASVVVQVAARAWRNPSCASMLTTGPFTEQFTSAVSEALYLTDQERGIVARATARPKLWTLGVYRDDETTAGYPDRFSGVIVPRSDYPPGSMLWGGAP